MTHCPNCGQEMRCGCENCLKYNRGRTKKNSTQVDYQRDTESCTRCGFTQHIDWWFDLSMTVATEKERIENAGK